MSDTVYAAGRYVRFLPSEVTAALATGFFASFVLTFNDWGDEVFDFRAGLTAWLSVFAFLFVALILVVLLCKLVAVRLGYVIEYEPHMIGLVIGMIVGVASAGYLPLFLPGGFRFHRPEMLRVGKFMGHYKGWEMGIITATFPLLMIGWVLILSPLYLATQVPVIATLIVACCLTAMFACIPLPGVVSGQHGNLLDWFRYLKGSTFGLEIFWNSPTGYVILSITVIIFSGLALLLTYLGSKVGLIMYGLSLALAMITLWVYTRFFR